MIKMNSTYCRLMSVIPFLLSFTGCKESSKSDPSFAVVSRERQLSPRKRGHLRLMAKRFAAFVTLRSDQSAKKLLSKFGPLKLVCPLCQ
jgi:hypothetical protein